VQSNLFNAAALNALFGTLHNNSGSKTIYISNNPKGAGTGTVNCTQSIATGKGWQVDTTN
jgi:hypothetical protein